MPVVVDVQFFITTGLGIAIGIMGWLGRELWEAVKKLRQDLSALELKIADNYVRTSAFESAVDRILKAIDDVRHDISNKADK
jgi:hypothetical protein